MLGEIRQKPENWAAQRLNKPKVPPPPENFPLVLHRWNSNEVNRKSKAIN